MNNDKNLANALAGAWDSLVDGINETPPFSWLSALATWLVDKLATALERVTKKEEHMEPQYMRNPEDAKRTETVGADGHLGGISAEEATENIRRNMELLNRPPPAGAGAGGVPRDLQREDQTGWCRGTAGVVGP